MRASKVWKQLKALVRMLAEQHPEREFTAVIDSLGRCAVAVTGDMDVVLEAAASARAAQIPEPWRMDRFWLWKGDRPELIWRAIESPRRRALDVEGAPKNAFLLSRLVHNESWAQPAGERPDNLPPTIAFYSFKGGVGRSTAAALTALAMARDGRRVLLLDMDLEAPGLEGYFGFEPDQVSGGLLDLLLERSLGADGPFDPLEYRLDYGEDREISLRGGVLHVVPAGRLDEAYPEVLGRVPLAELARDTGPQMALWQAVQVFLSAETYDFVLVDCRTGFSDLGGLALNGLADLNVLVFKAAQSERRYVRVVLEHMARLRQATVETEEDVRRLAHSLLVVFSLAQLPGTEVDAQGFVRELRDLVSRECWDQVFAALQDKGWSQADLMATDTVEEPVPHDVVVIPYLRDFPSLGLASDMSQNAAQLGVRGYDELVRRILDVKFPPLKEAPAPPSSPEERRVLGDVVTALQTLILEVQAEVDLKDTEALTQRFLPRLTYRGLLSPDVMIIQGAKGVGKSALFKVFQDRDYLIELARYVNLGQAQRESLRHTELIVGFDERASQQAQIEVQRLFQALTDQPSAAHHETLRGYWRALLCAELLAAPGETLQSLLAPGAAPPLPTLRERPTRANAVQLAVRLDVQGELLAWLMALGDRARAQKRELWVLYDGLDAHLTRDPGRRQQLLSALVDLWWSMRPLALQLRARIFLRSDLWEREVQLVDKAKLVSGTYRADLQWDPEELYRLLIKRLLYAESFTTLLKERGLYREDLEPREGLERLGRVPPDDREWLQQVVVALVGEHMGAGRKKGVTYTWLVKHLSDSRGRARPRSMFTLFKAAAKAQRQDAEGGAPIQYQHLRAALRGEVSEQAVQELREEYQQEWSLGGRWVPEVFQEIGTLWPLDALEVERALEERFPDRRADIPRLLEEMQAGGLLQRGQTRTLDRYYIPDIYLYGLGLTRRG